MINDYQVNHILWLQWFSLLRLFVNHFIWFQIRNSLTIHVNYNRQSLVRLTQFCPSPQCILLERILRDGFFFFFFSFSKIWSYPEKGGGAASFESPVFNFRLLCEILGALDRRIHPLDGEERGQVGSVRRNHDQSEEPPHARHYARWHGPGEKEFRRCSRYFHWLSRLTTLRNYARRSVREFWKKKKKKKKKKTIVLIRSSNVRSEVWSTRCARARNKDSRSCFASLELHVRDLERGLEYVQKSSRR